MTADSRVGPHPYFGRPDHLSDPCDLPGCGVSGMQDIHASAPGGSRVLEAAKAVARLAEDGLIVGTPTNTQGSRALILLEQAVTMAGHPTRPPRLSERVMQEVAEQSRRGDG